MFVYAGDVGGSIQATAGSAHGKNVLADARDFVTVAFTHVLLDLDHTLLDSDTSFEMAFADATAVAGAEAGADDRYPTFDMINRALWRQVEAQELSPQQVHVARFERLNDEAVTISSLAELVPIVINH